MFMTGTVGGFILFTALAAAAQAPRSAVIGGAGPPGAAPPVSAAAKTALTPAAPLSNDLDAGFHALYNLRFDEAQTFFTRFTQAHPEGPLGPASRASAYLFQELNRLGVLQAEFLTDDQKIEKASIGRPDARVRTQFYEEVQRAEARALALLAANPNDHDALLALSITYGSQADYLHMVEKRSLASLPLFKKSNRYAQALLKLNPHAYDAWTASGFTEYLAGSLPFYLRWVVRFDSVEGQKTRAVEQLRLASVRGRYLRPYAKILLAVLHLREKRPAETVRLLEELRAEFPDNPLFASELSRLKSRN